MKKLHTSLIFSNLMVSKPLNTIYLLMRNFITYFVRILGICKDFAGNRTMSSEMYLVVVLFPSFPIRKSSLLA